MDVVILMGAIGLVVFFFKRVFNVIYLIPIIDIFLRVINFIKTSINDAELYAFLNKFFPENIPVIIGKYTGGFVYDILIWVYVGIFIMFEYYIIREFFTKK